MGKKSVSRIVNETSETIAQVLLQDYVSPPETEEQWKNITQEFGHPEQFPHVVGVIGGKHGLIEAPAESSNLYHNCKGTFSIVVLAIWDVKYHFTLVDVGQYCSNNDSGVLAHSKISSAFENNYPKFTRMGSLARNKPRYSVLSSGKCKFTAQIFASASVSRKPSTTTGNDL